MSVFSLYFIELLFLSLFLSLYKLYKIHKVSLTSVSHALIMSKLRRNYKKTHIQLHKHSERTNIMQAAFADHMHKGKSPFLTNRTFEFDMSESNNPFIHF